MTEIQREVTCGVVDIEILYRYRNFTYWETIFMELRRSNEKH